MQNHTPGPWNYAADSLREGRFSIYANGPIAHCGDAARPGDGEANARLIAAAPELLRALELIHANAAESPEWIRARIDPIIARIAGA